MRNQLEPGDFVFQPAPDFAVQFVGLTRIRADELAEAKCRELARRVIDTESGWGQVGAELLAGMFGYVLWACPAQRKTAATALALLNPAFFKPTFLFMSAEAGDSDLFGEVATAFADTSDEALQRVADFAAERLARALGTDASSPVRRHALH